jgi:hypothetical protein
MASINESEWKEVDSFRPITTEMAEEYESIPSYIARNLSRSGARALESVVGIPRSAHDLLQMIGNFVTPESVQSNLSQQLQEIEPNAQFNPGIGSLFPSSEEAREAISYVAPSGYLEPQGNYEQLSDEIISDFLPLLIPMGPLGAVKPAKALKIAGASNLASFLTKKLGGSEKTQAGVKLGTALFSSLGMGPSLRNKAEQLYKVAQESIAPGEYINAKPLTDLTNKITREYISKGLSKAAGKADVDRIVEEINSFVHDGKMGLNDLWEIKKDMKDVGERIGFNTRGGKEITKLSQEMDKLLKNSPNKTFSQALAAADELYGGVKRGESITDFMKDTLKNKFIAGGALYGLLSHPGSLLKVGAAGLGGKKAYEIINNIIRYPHIRNEYGAMLNAAAKENAPLVLKHAKKLEKKIEKINPIEPINEDEWKEI